jgi:hypothetical protein
MNKQISEILRLFLKDFFKHHLNTWSNSLKNYSSRDKEKREKRLKYKKVLIFSSNFICQWNLNNLRVKLVLWVFFVCSFDSDQSGKSDSYETWDLFDSQKFNLQRMLERKKNSRNANLMAKIRPLVIHKLIVKMDVRYFRGESLHLLSLISKHDITWIQTIWSNEIDIFSITW